MAQAGPTGLGCYSPPYPQNRHKIGRAILTSRLTYGGTCFNLTQTQLNKVRTLHHKLLRVITGLPRHTKLNDLYTFASLPPIETTLEAARDNHSDRRELTVQGRHLIAYDETRTFTPGPSADPSLTRNPPWQWTQPVNHKPRSTKERKRHKHQRNTLSRFQHLLEPGTYAIYTDAALASDRFTCGITPRQRSELDRVHDVLYEIRNRFTYSRT